MLPIPFAAQAASVPDPSLPAIAAGVPDAVPVVVPAGGLYAGVVAGHHVSLLSVFTAGCWEDCAQFAADAGGSLPAFDEMVALRALGVSYAGPHWAADRANGDRALAFSFLSGLAGYSHTSQVFNGLVVRREAVVDAVAVAVAVAVDGAGAPANVATRYCYSEDEEFYQGEFDTPLAAAAEFFAGCPEQESVHVGEGAHAPTTEYVSADCIIDDITTRAYDEVGEVTDGWLYELSKNTEAKAELEKLVAAFIDKHERPTFWKVENCRQVTRAEVVAAGLLEEGGAA